MIKYIYAFFIISILFFGSCKSDTSSLLLPSVTGKAGEVLIVIDKAIWEDKVGELFDTILLAEYPSLPVAEPMFDPINIPPQAFNNMFKTHRNVIMTKIGSGLNNSISVQKDVWGETQLLINLNAKSVDDLIKLIEENKDNILLTLEDAERNRIIRNYKQYEERAIGEKLRDERKISLNIPAGYTIDREAEDFLWISHETPMISQGILIYYYNYVDSNTFTLDYLLNKRNEYLRKYVPGPTDGSYMTTTTDISPTFREFSLEKKYTAEIRGLWEVENDFMGGPFISFTTLDEARQRVVTVESFVYAPQYAKRNYLRQVEAILYTLKIED